LPVTERELSGIKKPSQGTLSKSAKHAVATLRFLENACE
jgi:hypothetical protein